MYDAEVAGRFWAKVDRRGPDECWLWLASGVRYGQFFPHRGSRRLAHRIAYELVIGPIPMGLVLDHLCKNTMCVNPTHLEAVTQRVNLMRSTSPSAVHAAKTHCPRGHEYAGSNLRIAKNGSRQCKTCRRAHDRRQYLRVKAR